MAAGAVNCVLLNADYTFLNIVHWKRAINLMAKGKTEVLKTADRSVTSAGGQVIKLPLVMRLIKLIRTLYRSRVPLSKRNILIRDGFKCAYCGNASYRLTLDHVIPRSRGGDTSFENCVAACAPCNHKKGNRMPSETGMVLRVRPFQPTIAEFLRIKMKRLGIHEVLVELGIY